MSNDLRSYSAWMKHIVDNNYDVVLRHDIDWDIKTTRKMLEVERRYGVTSVSYFILNSPAYTFQEIKELYRDFSKDGFLFGVHIDHDSYSTPEECQQAYLKDLMMLKENDIKVHSCAAHFWDCRLFPVPSYSNQHVEDFSTSNDVCPSFSSLYGGRKRLGDSNGRLSPSNWVYGLSSSEKYFLQTHPVYYRAVGDDVVFTKSIGATPDITRENIRNGQYAIRNLPNLTPYFLADPMEKPHLKYAVECFDKMTREQHKELLNVVDVGCGIGMLGTYLMRHNNVKYTGLDIEPTWVSAGNKLFETLGYGSQVRDGDLYKKCPEGNVLVFLAYEDCWTDYEQLYEVCKNFDQVLITIAGVHMTAEAAQRANPLKYWYIPHNEFEQLFCEEGDFNIASKAFFTNARHFYWLKKK